MLGGGPNKEENVLKFKKKAERRSQGKHSHMEGLPGTG